MKVLVFKTSVKNEIQVQQLQDALDNLISSGENWNFDLEDCDNILRFEAQRLFPDKVLMTLNYFGFKCEELE